MATIYADVVFLVNLIMNFLIFWTVGKLTKIQAKKYRVFIGALTASLLYCLIIFIPSLRGFYNFFTAIFILITALYITFGYKNIRTFAKLIIISHITAIILGGTTLAIYYYASTTIFAASTGISFRFLVVSTFFSFIIIKFGTHYIQKNSMSKQSFCEIQIFKGDSSTKLVALIDTGNTLVEPLSHFPVIIAEHKSIKNLIYDEGDSVAIADKIRMIPFKSIGAKNGMLIGFRPDKVEIKNNRESFEIQDVVIGICNFTLSKSGNYQGLLNPSIIK